MLGYKILSVFVYMVFFPVFFIIAIIMIATAWIYLPLFYKIDKLCCRLIMSSLLVWPRVRGEFPSGGTYIIMMNHSSFLDVFIFPLIPRGAYSGITSIENFKIPIFSTLLKQIQAIPVERKNRIAAIESIKIAENVLKQGIHIGILPEGTRTVDGSLGIMKKGGFHMAINTGTPIIPVGVSGAFKFKPKNRWWLKPGYITVNIGSVINPNTYRNLGIDGLKSQVKQTLIALSGELNETK